MANYSFVLMLPVSFTVSAVGISGYSSTRAGGRQSSRPAFLGAFASKHGKVH
jgi:hypothetical protein